MICGTQPIYQHKIHPWVRAYDNDTTTFTNHGYAIRTAVTWTLDAEGRRVQKQLGLVCGYAGSSDTGDQSSRHALINLTRFDQPLQTYPNATFQSYPITSRGHTPQAHHKDHDYTHQRYLQIEGSDVTNPPEEANHTPTGTLPEQLKEWVLGEPDASWISAELTDDRLTRPRLPQR